MNVKHLKICIPEADPEEELDDVGHRVKIESWNADDISRARIKVNSKTDHLETSFKNSNRYRLRPLGVYDTKK